ncbi:7438_t:CDS:2 [Entrophospora sp. SA101]|nr:7438_t:CDS:2 [Entrophospora sp. SA101]
MLKKNPTKNKNSSKRARSNSTERLLKRLTTNPPYKLTLPIDELIKPKTDYNAKLKAESQMTNLNNREKSKLIANIWNSQSSEVKQFFQILSMAANVKHKLTYPNYVYKPVWHNNLNTNINHADDDGEIIQFDSETLKVHVVKLEMINTEIDGPITIRDR